MKLTMVDHLALGAIAGTSLVTKMLYSRLPDHIATHFDVHGAPDGWTTRETGAFLLPCVSLGTWLLLRFGGFALPSTWKMRMLASPTAAAGALVSGLFCALQCIVLYVALEKPPTAAGALGLVLAVFWSAFGLVTPRIRRNPWLGVRTPWALTSDENWARTHRVAGYGFVLAGLLGVVAVASGWAATVPGLIVASALVPVVYSFLLARGLPPSP